MTVIAIIKWLLSEGLLHSGVENSRAFEGCGDTAKPVRGETATGRGATRPRVPQLN
jgi:hypothetical protein